MNNLIGKTAIVTGGGSGLGEATALALAEAGATVLVVDRNREAAERVANKAAQHAPGSYAAGADVSKWEDVRSAVEEAGDKLGRVDILVNCAGVDHTLPIHELTVDQWNQVIGVNLSGAFHSSKAVFPLMMENKSGHIINIASTAAKRGWSEATAYAASKFGIMGLTQALVAEGRRYGIKVSVLSPGGMATHFFDGRFDPPVDLSKLNSPKNVADLIVFMVSQPPESVINEVLICPINETSWP